MINVVSLFFLTFLSLINLIAAFPQGYAAASLTRVASFGRNPSGTMMYIYVPASLVQQPAIIVAIHYCAGSAWDYYQGTPYANLADEYGFIVIYPSSPHAGGCWDVSSTKSLTRNGDGDSNAIVNMVKYTLARYNADPAQVFVLGSSSGAMMTNVLAATYPELFAAAIAYSGAPAGCFSSSSNIIDAWNSSCARGQISAKPSYWSSIVHRMDPGYNDSNSGRPRMQIYHGSLDTTLAPELLDEEIKQWTAVFSYNSSAPESVEWDSPRKRSKTSIWGINVKNPLGMVRKVWARGVGHPVPVNGTSDMMWFGLGPYAYLYTVRNTTIGTTTGNPLESVSTASAKRSDQ